MPSSTSIVTRRRILAQIAMTGPAAALCSRLAAAETGPDVTFPVKPRDRLSVTSYPFRAYIDSPSNAGRDPSKAPMDLKDFAAMIAKRFNVYNINPVADHFHSTDGAYLDAFKASLETAKSHIVDLGLSGRNFYDPERAHRDEAVRYGCQWIDIARHVGSPSVRQHIHAARGVPRNVSLAADSLKRMADYGAKQNIVVNLENDSAITEDPYFLLAVIEKANSPYLRALPDFGNSMQHHDEAFNEKAVKAMFGHAYNMAHVKNVITGKGGVEYKINVAKMFAIAKASSYRGYFSMEYDSGSGDTFEGTDTLIRESLAGLA
jgi:sugar phosphate isomerase/epimerase